jgi:hypothetical protein
MHQQAKIKRKALNVFEITWEIDETTFFVHMGIYTPMHHRWMFFGTVGFFL